MKGETEIEGLARMVANGFSAMDKRFDGLEERMDGFDDRMESFENRLDRVEENQQQTNNLIQRIIIPALDQNSRRIKDLELKIA